MDQQSINLVDSLVAASQELQVAAALAREQQAAQAQAAVEQHVEEHKAAAAAAAAGGSSSAPTASSSSSSSSKAPTAANVIIPPGGNLIYLCTECGRYCHSASKLEAHMRVHTREKPYVCSYSPCFKRFSQKGDLTRHERSHMGIRPHMCPSCNKQFFRASHLNEHLKAAHDPPAGVPFQCSFCNRCFKKKSNLTAHERTHDRVRFKCHWCAKTFSRQRDVKRHLRSAHSQFPVDDDDDDDDDGDDSRDSQNGDDGQSAGELDPHVLMNPLLAAQAQQMARNGIPAAQVNAQLAQAQAVGVPMMYAGNPQMSYLMSAATGRDMGFMMSAMRPITAEEKKAVDAHNAAAAAAAGLPPDTPMMVAPLNMMQQAIALQSAEGAAVAAAAAAAASAAVAVPPAIAPTRKRKSKSKESAENPVSVLADSAAASQAAAQSMLPMGVLVPASVAGMSGLGLPISLPAADDAAPAVEPSAPKKQKKQRRNA